MKIPLLDLKAQYRSIQTEIDTKILEVIASQMFILGAEVEGLEHELAAYCDAEYGIGVSSGSDALIISLMALGIGPGDSVYTSPFTFFATAGAVARVGATPIFCDIEEESFNLSPASFKQALSENLNSTGKNAVIPVHLYGQIADMEPICYTARENGLFVIEDAAQAVGAEYAWKDKACKACTMGDLGTLSFFPSKNLGGFGDAGMVLTNNAELAAKIKLMRMHGAKDRYFYDMLGGNFRLDALQAAILRVKLKHLNTWQKKRRERAIEYKRLFAEAGLIAANKVTTPLEVPKSSGLKNNHTYHQYVIRVKKRDSLKSFLQEKGISTGVYYPLGLHLQKCFAYLGYKEGDFPVTEKASREVLALPIYPELSLEQQEYIVNVIRDFFIGIE